MTFFYSYTIKLWNQVCFVEHFKILIKYSSTQLYYHEADLIQTVYNIIYWKANGFNQENLLGFTIWRFYLKDEEYINGKNPSDFSLYGPYRDQIVSLKCTDFISVLPFIYYLDKYFIQLYLSFSAKFRFLNKISNYIIWKVYFIKEICFHFYIFQFLNLLDYQKTFWCP